MSEEVKQEQIETNEDSKPEVSLEDPIEQEARSKGWRPAEEAVENGLDPNDAVDAKTYLDREPFIKEIKRVKQQNRSLTQRFDKLMQRLDKAEMEGYERALQELQIQRNEAYDNLEPDRVRQIDAEIEKQKQAKEALEQQQKQQPNFDPEVLEFIEFNKDWWGKDQAAMQFAAATEQALRTAHPNKDLSDIFAEVQARVDAFRGKPSTPEQGNKVSYVAPPTRASGNSGHEKSYNFHDLTNESKDLYNNLRMLRKEEFGKDYPVDQFVKDQLKAGYVKLEEIIRK